MNHKISLDKLIDYIENHLEEDLSLDNISRNLNYSKYYIARFFSEKAGITVCEYIRRRRLTLAAQKLVETKQPIIEIAYETGYNSQQAFNLAFRRFYLCTPQTYRKNGIFYPLQTKLSLQSTLSLSFYSNITTGFSSITSGGRMVA